MKTGIIASKTIASPNLQKSVMGMSMKGMEIAQYFLRDRIYSNKILAIVREYTCNAYDEHIKHDITRPVEINIVNLPNQPSEWVVRDYALGLDEHDIRNIFGMYFESTKCDSNQSIGGFGVGSKAGFSYTDMFFVTSHHKGIGIKYVCSLGASDSGIPVGEIFKLEEFKTEEQGIEIRIEIKSGDLDVFQTITSNFVKSFHDQNGLKYLDGISGYIVTPQIPTHKIEMGGYIVNKYSEPFHQETRYRHIIRMGGVIYPYSYSNLNTNGHLPFRKFNGSIVVDVPIGKLSIPISRENIENTAQNKRTFEEILQILEKIHEDDKASIKCPNFGEAINAKINNTYYQYQTRHQTVWFTTTFNELFPDLSSAVSQCSVDYGNLNFKNVEIDKHIIYVLPDKRSTKSWAHRLNIYMRQTISSQDPYVYTTTTGESLIKNSNIDISNFQFVNVKTLKLPVIVGKKLTNTEDRKYKVCHCDYRKSLYKTPKELEELVQLQNFNNIPITPNWYESVETFNNLKMRTICYASPKSYAGIWKCSSNKLIEDMKSIGWLTPDMPEYENQFNRIREQNDHNQLISNINSKYFNITKVKTCSQYVLNALMKNRDRFHKIQNIFLEIGRENSHRSRILESLNKYNSNLSRSDLRKILLIK